MKPIDRQGVVWDVRFWEDKVMVLRGEDAVYDLAIPAEHIRTWRVTASVLGFHTDGRPVIRISFDYVRSEDAHLEPGTQYFVGPDALPYDPHSNPQRFTECVYVQPDGRVLYQVLALPRNGPRSYDILRMEHDGSTSLIRAASPFGYESLVSAPDGTVRGYWNSVSPHETRRRGTYLIGTDADIYHSPDFPFMF